MKLSLKGLLAVGFSFAVSMSSSAAALAADQPAPSPSATSATPASPSVVMDNAHMLSSADTSKLTTDIQQYDQTYGLVFVVETVPALNGQSIESAALARANQLGVGQAGKDNGVFLYIARDDHKIRFELGRGVSAKVSDATATSIISSEVTPQFKRENYLAGMENGMSAVGKEYTGAHTDYSGDQSSSQPITWDGTAWTVLLLALAGSVLLFGLPVTLYTVFFGDKAERRRAEKRWSLLNERNNAVRELARTIKNSKTGEYVSLPNETERIAWVQAHYPEIVPVLKVLDNGALSTHRIDEYLFTETHGLSLGSMFGDPTADALVKHYVLSRKGFEKVSISEANTRIAKEQERNEKRLAKQRAERLERKEQAQKAWDSLPADTQAQLRKARKKREQQAILANTNSSYDFNVLFPVIYSMFLANSASSSGGSSYSGGSSTSSSGSSTHDSGYSGYNGGYDGGSSSFGGGGFDGGGGSGSW